MIRPAEWAMLVIDCLLSTYYVPGTQKVLHIRTVRHSNSPQDTCSLAGHTGEHATNLIQTAWCLGVASTLVLECQRGFSVERRPVR